LTTVRPAWYESTPDKLRTSVCPRRL
jgi:hypothetical protein